MTSIHLIVIYLINLKKISLYKKYREFIYTTNCKVHGVVVDDCMLDYIRIGSNVELSKLDKNNAEVAHLLDEYTVYIFFNNFDCFDLFIDNIILCKKITIYDRI